MDREQLEKRKKTVYDFICDDLYVPMKAKEIAVMLSVSKEDREALQEVLEELVWEGKIELSKRGKYSKAEKKYLTGIFTAHQKGFGFVTVEGEEEDIRFRGTPERGESGKNFRAGRDPRGGDF